MRPSCCVLLPIGIVKKNSIMLVDFAAEAKRDEELNGQDAVAPAAEMRFRPS